MITINNTDADVLTELNRQISVYKSYQSELRVFLTESVDDLSDDFPLLKPALFFSIAFFDDRISELCDTACHLCYQSSGGGGDFD